MKRVTVAFLRGALLVGAFLPGAGSMIVACGAREHMGPNQGRQTHEFVERQRIRTDAAQGNPAGLDSEEAAIIQGTYRKTVGAPTRTEGVDSPARVLLLEEPDDAPKH